MAGYSGTPLAKKLGIRAGSRVAMIGAPAHYRTLLDPIPEGVQFARQPGATTELVHLFTTERAELEARLPVLRDLLAADAAVWVSWPKKQSKVPTDITEDVVRAVALPLGLVDVKVCAVDEVWSGLKLVVRKALR
jgi:hypothetical protein